MDSIMISKLLIYLSHASMGQLKLAASNIISNTIVN